jgi:hypothetical protein
MKPDLEKRIVAALDGNLKAADLEGLVAETIVAIDRADADAAIQRERALDPALSPDAKAAREAMVAAEFARDRLRTVLPRLRSRLAERIAQEKAAEWNETYTRAEAVRDAAAREFSRYTELVGELVDIFRQAAEADRLIDAVNASAVSGEPRRLLGVELTARGLDRFSSSSPSIVREAVLPDFENSGTKLWPPKPPFNAALFAAEPYNPRFSVDWGLLRE